MTSSEYIRASYKSFTTSQLGGFLGTWNHLIGCGSAGVALVASNYFENSYVLLRPSLVLVAYASSILVGRLVIAASKSTQAIEDPPRVPILLYLHEERLRQVLTALKKPQNIIQTNTTTLSGDVKFNIKHTIIDTNIEALGSNQTIQTTQLDQYGLFLRLRESHAITRLTDIPPEPLTPGLIWELPLQQARVLQLEQGTSEAWVVGFSRDRADWISFRCLPAYYKGDESRETEELSGSLTVVGWLEDTELPQSVPWTDKDTPRPTRRLRPLCIER